MPDDTRRFASQHQTAHHEAAQYKAAVQQRHLRPTGTGRLLEVAVARKP